MVLNMSVAEREILLGAFGRLPHVTHELRFWSKALPFSTNNYFLFERKFLSCYRIWVKVKHFTICHQLSIKPKLPNMKWPSRKVKPTWWCLNGSDRYTTGTMHALIVQVTGRSVLISPGFCCCYITFSLPARMYASGAVPYDQLMRNRNKF